MKLLKPESFRTHFEAWRRFSTEETSATCLAVEAQADTDTDGVAEPFLNKEVSASSLDLEQLRAAILQDVEPGHLLFFSRKGILAGVIACTLLAGTIWIWYGRTHQSDANVQTSSSRNVAVTPDAMSTPTVTQSPLEPASRQSTDVSPISNTPENSQSGESNKPVVVPKHNEHRGASREQIVVNLNRFTPVKAKLLHNPDRIYFDLSPGTRPKLSERFTLGSGSRLVRRVRIGHAEDGHTRVVLDLRQQCDYQANISRMPPYKLIINIRTERIRGTS